MLLQIRKFVENAGGVDNQAAVHYFGQELKNQTYNLARMNMMLHRVPGSHQHLRNGDSSMPTGRTDEPHELRRGRDESALFPEVRRPGGVLSDPRFAPYKKLRPRARRTSRSSSTGSTHLKEAGTMGIVLPHGCYSAGRGRRDPPTIVGDGEHLRRDRFARRDLLLDRDPDLRDHPEEAEPSRDVLFIDASKDFKKERAKNYLMPEHLEKIFQAYLDRKDVEKYAHLASFDEIRENDCQPQHSTLSTPRRKRKRSTWWRSSASLRIERRKLRWIGSWRGSLPNSGSR